MICLIRCAWQRWLALMGGMATVLAGVWAWSYTVDDAFIVAGYARRLASGSGYTLSGDGPTDGVTGPLWLLPGWLGAHLGAEPIFVAKAVGLVLGAASVMLVLDRLGRRFSGRAIGGVALLLLAVQPTVPTWSVAGLETAAAMLAVCVAVLTVTARPTPRLRSAALAVAALPWLRPELVVVGSVVAAFAHVRVGRKAWVVSGALAASVCSVAMFRLVMFHSMLPLAFHAKLGTVIDGMGYTSRALAVMSGAGGLWMCALGWMRGRSDDRLVALVLLAHAGAVTFAGGDWMPGFRLFAPVLPLYVWLAAAGFQRSVRTRIGAISGIVALSFACVVPLLDWVTRMPELRSSAMSRERVGAELADALVAHATRVALVDIGYLSYRSGVEVIDLGGITDPQVALMPGGHLDKHVTSEWLEGRAPDAIVLHSRTTPNIDDDGRLQSLAGYPVEMRVARSAWVRERFRVVKVFHYAPSYDYVLLLPSAKASPRAM